MSRREFITLLGGAARREITGFWPGCVLISPKAEQLPALFAVRARGFARRCLRR
jgi:hypothetical protein